MTNLGNYTRYNLEHKFKRSHHLAVSQSQQGKETHAHERPTFRMSLPNVLEAVESRMVEMNEKIHSLTEALAEATRQRDATAPRFEDVVDGDALSGSEEDDDDEDDDERIDPTPNPWAVGCHVTVGGDVQKIVAFVREGGTSTYLTSSSNKPGSIQKHRKVAAARCRKGQRVYFRTENKDHFASGVCVDVDEFARTIGVALPWKAESVALRVPFDLATPWGCVYC